MIYVLQNLLAQAQLEILLARLESGELEIESESWSPQPKVGDLASMIVYTSCLYVRRFY